MSTEFEKMKMSKYQFWNMIGKGIGILFAVLGVIFVNVDSGDNDLAFWICFLLASAGAGITIYNDYKHEKYTRILEWVIAIAVLIIMTAVYWFFQSAP